MSIGALAGEPPSDGAVGAFDTGPVLRARISAIGLPLRAFLYSRLAVLLAGVVGVLMVTKRAGAVTTSAYLHQLGPVGYVLAGAADRFDSAFYLGIAGHGYAVGPSSLAFYPLYPYSIRVLGWLTGDVIGAVLISMISFAVALVLLHRLAELELGRRAADATVLLVAFAPLSFFFSAIYSESLFLLLSVATMLAGRRQRWMLAGVLGGLAALTRPTGVLLLIPIVIMRLRCGHGFDRKLGWVLLVPLAVVAYLLVLGASGFGWLAPFHAEANWSRVSVTPIVGFAAGLSAAIRGAGDILGGGAIYHPTLSGPFTPGAQSIVLFAGLVLVCAALVSCLRRLPLEYGAYAAAAVLVWLSNPQIGQPLVSSDRYALTMFPLWMAAGAWVAKRRLERPAVAVGSILLVFYTIQFSSWAFVG